jgi:amidophosphoribosyltransferase
MAIGHVRYGTTGGNTRSNIQPMTVRHRKGNLALAHNGNLTNSLELREELEMSGAIFQSTSDTETISYMITRERLTAPSIEEAVLSAMHRLRGAYSLVMMSSTKLLAVRDPGGFRPLCLGIRPDGGYAVASESCALDAVGAEFIRDVEPGEMLVFSAEHPKEAPVSYRRHCGCRQTPCIFEYIYFARPDSVIDGVSVHAARQRAGAALSQTHPVSADVVVGVPDSGLDAAIGYSQASGIPYGIGLIKNKYIGRTFIAPDARADQVRIKLAPIRETVEGKRIVLIDDSIVRGTTCERIVRLFREAGAKEIHMRVTAPPFLYPCYYGTDIDSQENLIACRYSVSEICHMIGADSLGYLPVQKLQCLTGHTHFCSACFCGEYPTPVPKANSKRRFEQRLSERSE